MSLYVAYLLGSVVLDILANMALSVSDGFKKKRWGVMAVLLIMAAFAFLALAVQGMPLIVAYTVRPPSSPPPSRPAPRPWRPPSRSW